MDQVQNMELSKDQIIQELIALLNQNQQKKAANDVFEMAILIDGMGKRLEQVTEELNGVRRQLEKMEQEKVGKTLKATVHKAVDSLEQQSRRMKEQLFEIKTEVKTKATEIVTETKVKGKAVLHKVSEFLGIKAKLESVRDNVRQSIWETERTIAKLDAFGSGMREAGQKIANTFRTFADKETVDYDQKEKKFSKTELVKKPFEAKKKLYQSMEKHLNAAIDRLENLVKDVSRTQEKDKELLEAVHTENQPEQVCMVAESSEYQYGAEAFEAAYDKGEQIKMSEGKTPEAPKTGKSR